MGSLWQALVSLAWPNYKDVMHSCLKQISQIMWWLSSNVTNTAMNDKYTVHLSGHWQFSPMLNDLLRAAIPIVYERFASPLDVHPDTQAYWTPSTANKVFGAQHDSFSTAWQGCSQADPTRLEDMMDTAVGWAMASALTTQDPVMTIMNLNVQPASACAKWLEHPLVHVMLKIQPRRNANWSASRFLA